ncbi:hypothetical protein LXA43DRAFT_896997 [Ganoderma leucocontextum]|nr:hypothetical protein LXA43DRAFT_896997 [Ganoderma leucocontextum]
MLDSFTLPTLSRLRSTCHEADKLVAVYLDRRYNVLLLRFVQRAPAFRSLLTKIGGFVSGSAGAALATNLYVPHNLDVYVPLKGLTSLLQHLLQVEGYTIIPPPPDGIDYDRFGVSQVIRLVRNGVRIDVIESPSKSAAYPVLTFWATPCMELFGGDSIVMPYPRLTENRRGLYNTLTTVEAEDVTFIQSLADTYEHYGYDIRDHELDWFKEPRPDTVCRRDRSAACPHTMRWIGDPFSLVTTFGTISTRLTARPLQGRASQHTTVWWRGGPSCGGRCDEGGFRNAEIETYHSSLVQM